MPIDNSVPLDGSEETTNLGLGYAITAPGFVGKANVRAEQPAAVLRGTATISKKEELFVQVLEDNEFQEQKVIELEGSVDLLDRSAPGVRGRTKAITLQVRAPGPEFNQSTISDR